MDRARAARVLGVDVGATSTEVREAFRRRAREVHPDTSGGDDAAMVELNAAYETLAVQTGPDWQFAGESVSTSWVTPDPPLHDDAEVHAGSFLRFFGIALAVVSVVMTTVVFVAAVGYDWSLSP
jgi:hypothetical protein